MKFIDNDTAIEVKPGKVVTIPPSLAKHLRALGNIDAVTVSADLKPPAWPAPGVGILYFERASWVNGRTVITRAHYSENRNRKLAVHRWETFTPIDEGNDGDATTATTVAYLTESNEAIAAKKAGGQ